MGVARTRAVFSGVIAKGSEHYPACLARDLPDHFVIHCIRVHVPPNHPAFVRTEFLLFGSGGLGERGSALTTDRSDRCVWYFSCDTTEAISATE